MSFDSRSIEQVLLRALADEANDVRISPVELPTHVDGSLLASLWQKAIRRGQVDWAVSAGIALHERDPEYVWRRIRVIALEEVSVAAPALVAQILAIAGKRVLRGRWGERRLLIYLTHALARSPKCRTPCDLASWVEPPGERAEESRLPSRTRDFVSGDLEVIRRSSTAWHDAVPLSTRMSGRWVSSGRGSLQRRREFLERVKVPPLLRFIVERGGNTYALNALCIPAAQLKAIHVEPRPQAEPPVCADALIQGIPAYAYCMYSAPGREALRRLARHPDWASNERIRVRKEALSVLGNLIFYVEGAYCADMLEVAHGTRIERASERALLGRLGIRPDDVPSLMQAARETLPLLNTLRTTVAVMK